MNTLAALAARPPCRTPTTSGGMSTEVLAARELLYVGLEKLGIPYYDSDGNFVLMQLGERAIEVRDKLREAGVLVRDRSYEIAGLRARDRRHARPDAALLSRSWSESGEERSAVLVFDMDGVLVDVTESYRETIRADRAALHRPGRSHAS